MIRASRRDNRSISNDGPLNLKNMFRMISLERWNQLKFITSNADKVREASKILNCQLEQVSTLMIHEIQTYDINKIVEHKARQAYEELKCPVLVEDSGLIFAAWNGLPGALVKWFEISVGCEGVLKMLEGFENREAFAVCMVAVFNGDEMCVTKGEVRGKISYSVRGENGFGWDTIFIPDRHDRTFAEMSFSEKNTISHRRQAFEELKKKI